MMNLVESRNDRAEVMENNVENVLEMLRAFGQVCDYMTEPMVANFYGVPNKTIETIANRNKEELKSYGYRVYKKSEVLNLQIEGLENIPNRGLRLYPINAVIVIGMLLTESKRAEQLRRNIVESETRRSRLDELVLKLFHCKNATESILIANEISALRQEEQKAIDQIKIDEVKTEKEEVEQERDTLSSLIDTMFGTKDLEQISTIGKILANGRRLYFTTANGERKQFGHNNIFVYLRENKILRKDNLPYSSYAKYIEIKYKGEYIVAFFNKEGVKWFFKRLVKDGILKESDIEKILEDINEGNTEFKVPRGFGRKKLPF